MKRRYVLFHKFISVFMRGAQGGGYGRAFLPLFLVFSCVTAFVFAALFHFLGALGACAAAATLFALALAHFDAYESEQSQIECPPSPTQPAAIAHRKKKSHTYPGEQAAS